MGAVNLVLTQRVQWRAQVTERFSKAVEQFGQQEPGMRDVRIGAVYALEQIARDSPDLHWPIMEVLTAYLRDHARVAPYPITPDGTTLRRDRPANPTPADHQAIRNRDRAPPARA